MKRLVLTIPQARILQSRGYVGRQADWPEEWRAVADLEVDELPMRRWNSQHIDGAIIMARLGCDDDQIALQMNSMTNTADWQKVRRVIRQVVRDRLG